MFWIKYCFMLSIFLSLPFKCRSTDFTSSSNQLFDGFLLHDFSSSPNLVITLLFGNMCGSQLWPITVLVIGTRQGCELLNVVSPHLILVAWICVCIIIGNLDRVIDALRQVDLFCIKFKSIVGRLSLARCFFWSKFGQHISVWQHSVRVNCGQ